MIRPLDTSAANTTCQILKSLVAIAVIAIGSSQTVNAGALFGNVTSDLFEPAVTPTSVLHVNANDPNVASIEPVLEPEEVPEAMTTVPEEPPLPGPIPSRSRSQLVQTSRQPRIDTRIDVSDLRNRPLRRPPALLPLYITFATLQMLDAHSTTKALQNGGVEANPVVASFAGNTGALYATKIATVAATVFIGEKLWRKNRFGAIMTMMAINSAYAVVVRHNYGIASR